MGDSSALLGATVSRTAAKPSSSSPPTSSDVVYDLLIGEHSATNPSEYERMLGASERGGLLQFVYEAPGLIEDGNAPTVWRRSAAGSYEIDDAEERRARQVGTPAKNVRGELPALLLTPKADPRFAAMEPQSLAVTRAIGDFYMHTFGVSCEPEVRVIDLEAKRSELIARHAASGGGGSRRWMGSSGASASAQLTLILASDGIWDLWEADDVFEAIAEPVGPGEPSTARARSFLEASVERGAECFGSSADNMTAIVIHLHSSHRTGSKSPQQCPVL